MGSTTEVIQVYGACKQVLRIAEGVTGSLRALQGTGGHLCLLSKEGAGGCHMEVWSKPGRLPPPSHLELCHLLFQIDDELLDPGIIGLVVTEFLLTEMQKGLFM